MEREFNSTSTSRGINPLEWAIIWRHDILFLFCNIWTLRIRMAKKNVLSFLRGQHISYWLYIDNNKNPRRIFAERDARKKCGTIFCFLQFAKIEFCASRKCGDPLRWLNWVWFNDFGYEHDKTFIFDREIKYKNKTVPVSTVWWFILFIYFI